MALIFYDDMHFATLLGFVIVDDKEQSCQSIE